MTILKIKISTVLTLLILSLSTLTASAQDNFSIENGNIRLPGTLCAATTKDAPIVVFVHGSGPCDRDETIGPNKLFKQLSEALQQKNIATLRYDKRTLLYKGGADTITYKEETVDDAVVAVKQLADQGYNRIFVAGHSLGGHCIPLIAQECGHLLEGVISLSGNVSSLEAAINSQLRFLGSRQGATDEQIQAAINQMVGALPKVYRDYDKTYSPTTVAKIVIQNLPRLRWMVVGGGHDYQVTALDFSMWQMALGSKATYYFGDTLDHLLRPLPQMAAPQDYLVEGDVDKEVLDAIASFINNSTNP